MKIMVASDIHGSAYWCEKLIENYKNESPEKLILLGDILYHGPRNDLPKGYDPKRVVELLGEISDKILCVIGNCDSDVDNMVLSFPIKSEFLMLSLNEKLIYFAHGHQENLKDSLKLKENDILICGHTHVPKISKDDGYTYLNPGSVSIPKEDSANSFMVIGDSKFIWKDLNGKAYNELEL